MTMTITDQALDDIKTDLISGIRLHNRQRSRRRIAAMVPVLGLLAAAGLVVASGDDQPAYAFNQRADGTIRVEVFPDFDDVGALQRDLRAAGLDAVVVQLRAHPSLEGLVEVVSHDNEASGAVEIDGAEFVIDIGAVDGEIEILVYSATEAGGQYQVSPSVFAPGEPLAGLHCASTSGPLLSDEFARRAGAAGIERFAWTVFGSVDDETQSIEFTEHAERPDGAIVGAQMRDAETVQVFLEPTATEPAAVGISMHDGTHDREVPSCTPALAAAWE